MASRMESPIINSAKEFACKDMCDNVDVASAAVQANMLRSNVLNTTKVNDENSCSTSRSSIADVDSEDKSEDVCSSGIKFVEVPVPKINPWTVNRNAAQVITGVPLKSATRSYHGIFLPCFLLRL